MLDTGPFLLTFTEEEGADKIRKIIGRHEAGEIKVYIHPNNLAEAYKIISMIEKDRPRLVKRKVNPRIVIRSAYATLSVIQDEVTTVNLGSMRLKYRNKPWGDLSSAALALALSNQEEKVPVAILDHERHFEDIDEVVTLRMSQL